MANKYLEQLKNGILTQNPTFVQLLGMCPTLATTTSVVNALGMGLATTVVLTFSNLFISLVRKILSLFYTKNPDLSRISRRFLFPSCNHACDVVK